MNSNNACCRFCGRIFRSAQGVRAHLKSCARYLEKKNNPHGLPRQALREPRQPKRESPKPLLEAEIYTEIKLSDGSIIYRGEDGMLYFENTRERLLYYRDLEAKRNAKDKLRLHDEQTKLRRTQEEESRKRQEADAKQRVQEEKGLREQRRKIIQKVKHTVIDCHIIWPSMPAEAKSKATIDIERTLIALPVSELPLYELIQIAEGVREKTYSFYRNPKDSKNPAKKMEVTEMAKKRLYSGLFQCSICDNEFQLDLASENELRCDCGNQLEEISDDEDAE
jgi:hypothetical protein